MDHVDSVYELTSSMNTSCLSVSLVFRSFDGVLPLSVESLALLLLNLLFDTIVSRPVKFLFRLFITRMQKYSWFFCVLILQSANFPSSFIDSLGFTSLLNLCSSPEFHTSVSSYFWSVHVVHLVGVSNSSCPVLKGAPSTSLTNTAPALSFRPFQVLSSAWSPELLIQESSFSLTVSPYVVSLVYMQLLDIAIDLQISFLSLLCLATTLAQVLATLLNYYSNFLPGLGLLRSFLHSAPRVIQSCQLTSGIIAICI